MKTCVIQIGNTDNKLTQEQWARFIKDVDAILKGVEIHFRGGSAYDSPYQNACWVCTVNDDIPTTLKDHLTFVRKLYNQDAAALTIGDTLFV